MTRCSKFTAPQRGRGMKPRKPDAREVVTAEISWPDGHRSTRTLLLVRNAEERRGTRADRAYLRWLECRRAQ
jgi:hypothetical protein